MADPNECGNKKKSKIGAPADSESDFRAIVRKTGTKFDMIEKRVLQELSVQQELSEEMVAGKPGLEGGEIGEVLDWFKQRRLLVQKDHSGRYALNEELGYVAAVDMGGTNLRYLIANLGGRVLNNAEERVTNVTGPRGTIDQIRRRIAELMKETPNPKELRAIAIGVPSAVDPGTGLLISANNLAGWSLVEMKPALEEEFKIPVLLENDCNMAAVGEHWRGAAVNVPNFVFLGIGTGIGSGIFVDGKLYRGRSGSAGEVYLMNVDWRLWNETFPGTGHVESYISGVGIAERARETGVLAKREGPSVQNDDDDSRSVFAAMHRGDARARRVIEEMFTVLGVTVANMIAVLDPELIVLNGGLTGGAPDLLLDTVNRVVRRIHADPPAVRLSALGDKAQIYGALWTALSRSYEDILQGPV